MILVDTSVWIDFFRGKENAKTLSIFLDESRVVIHPWVFGELMMGDLGPRRQEVLSDLMELPQTQQYSISELKMFADRQKIFGKGLSLVDLHVLFSAVRENHQLWTHDRSLHQAAHALHRVF